MYLFENLLIWNLSVKRPINSVREFVLEKNVLPVLHFWFCNFANGGDEHAAFDELVGRNLEVFVFSRVFRFKIADNLRRSLVLVILLLVTIDLCRFSGFVSSTISWSSLTLIIGSRIWSKRNVLIAATLLWPRYSFLSGLPCRNSLIVGY